MKPKGGKGPGEPTGYNYNDLLKGKRQDTLNFEYYARGKKVNTNEGKISFTLYGDEVKDFSPSELTKFLGIDPTATSIKGERLGKYPKSSRWEFSTGKKSGELIDVYDMGNEIVAILEPKKELIIEAIEKFHLSPCLNIVLWISTNEDISTPAIGFESSVIKFLSEIDASIDIDTYRN